MENIHPRRANTAAVSFSVSGARARKCHVYKWEIHRNVHARLRVHIYTYTRRCVCVRAREHVNTANCVSMCGARRVHTRDMLDLNMCGGGSGSGALSRRLNSATRSRLLTGLPFCTNVCPFGTAAAAVAATRKNHGENSGSRR